MERPSSARRRAKIEKMDWLAGEKTCDAEPGGGVSMESSGPETAGEGGHAIDSAEGAAQAL